MKTTINLYNHVGIIATSEVLFNPMTLIECYINFIDNPEDYILVVKTSETSEGMGETCYILTNGYENEWNVVVEDDWFEATGVDFDSKAEVIQYFKDCIRTSIKIEETSKAW